MSTSPVDFFPEPEPLCGVHDAGICADMVGVIAT
jgi:hypothetical protein